MDSFVLNELQQVKDILERLIDNPPQIDLTEETLKYIKLIRSISFKASILEQELLRQIDKS